MIDARIFAAAVLTAAVLVGCSDPDPVTESHEGRLEDGDSVLEQDNSLYDEYSFRAAEGWNINVTMNSGEFDTYLHLLDPDGNTLMQNDDVEAGNTNSAINTTAPKSGEYKVLANSLDSSNRGAYTVTINAQPAQ